MNSNLATQGYDPAKLLADELAGKYPDARGRFGPFGGRYIPETLIAAFEKLEAGIKQHLHAPDFQAELARELKSWVGPADGAHLRVETLARLGGRGVAQARRPRAHRRAQDQQRTGAGHAREAARRHAHRRGNRRRTARRRHRRGLRSRRPAVHGVHGRRGHGAPGAERGPHEVARHHRGAGHQRRPDVARRDR